VDGVKFTIFAEFPTKRRSLDFSLSVNWTVWMVTVYMAPVNLNHKFRIGFDSASSSYVDVFWPV